MATKPKKLVVDCSTGVTAEIEMTDEEIAANKAQAEYAAQIKTQMEAETQAKAEAKASALAKLAALGLTEEEAKVIAG